MRGCRSWDTHPCMNISNRRSCGTKDLGSSAHALWSMSSPSLAAICAAVRVESKNELLAPADALRSANRVWRTRTGRPAPHLPHSAPCSQRQLRPTARSSDTPYCMVDSHRWIHRPIKRSFSSISGTPQIMNPLQATLQSTFSHRISAIYHHIS